jgi:hypothetical protein
MMGADTGRARAVVRCVADGGRWITLRVVSWVPGTVRVRWVHSRVLRSSLQGGRLQGSTVRHHMTWSLSASEKHRGSCGGHACFMCMYVCMYVCVCMYVNECSPNRAAVTSKVHMYVCIYPLRDRVKNGLHHAHVCIHTSSNVFLIRHTTPCTCMRTLATCFLPGDSWQCPPLLTRTHRCRRGQLCQRTCLTLQIISVLGSTVRRGQLHVVYG